MSMLTSRRWAFDELLRGLRRDAGVNAFSVLLAALALAIPLLIALVFYGLSEPLRSVPTSVEVTIFTKDGVDAKLVEKAVNQIPRVLSSRIIDKNDALAELNAQLGLPQKSESGNPLPDIVVAVLDDDASAAESSKAVEQIRSLEGVDFVPFEASWHEKLRAATKAAWVGLICLGTITALLVALVLETAVRMTTASARREMRTLYLVGATPAFAARPYAWRGIVLMGLAAALALCLSEAGITLLKPYLDHAAELYGASVTLELPEAIWCLGFIGACAAAGGVTASLSALKTWRSIADSR